LNVFFQFPTTVSEYGAVNHIAVSPVNPYYVAVTDTSRVTLKKK
jgi:hypothetical protein